MPLRSQEDQELILIRILYTALIKAVLVAWKHGCPVANPHADIRFLSRNNHLIIDSIVSYFNSVPLPKGIEYHEQYDTEYFLPEGAEQLIPMYEAISQLHHAVIYSDHKHARRIAGETKYDTISNMIVFFNDQPE